MSEEREPEQPMTLAEVENEINKGLKLYAAHRHAKAIILGVREAESRRDALTQEVAALEALVAEHRAAEQAAHASLQTRAAEIQREFVELDTRITARREEVERGMQDLDAALESKTREVNDARDAAVAAHERARADEDAAFAKTKGEHDETIRVLVERQAVLTADIAQLEADLDAIAQRATRARPAD